MKIGNDVTVLRKEKMKKKAIDELREVKRELNRLIKKCKGRMKNAPQGSLNISMKNGKPMYYWNTNENGKRKKYYLGGNNDFKVSMLAQKSFDEKVIKVAEEQIKIVDSFLKKYNERALIQIYEDLSAERKTLVGDDILDDNEYVKRWEAVEYDAGRFEPGAPEYYTLKGERVRSKSEKIIADTLFINGIPYRYEYPVFFNDGRMWRPDFTILNVRTREEYILEHLGMLDNPDYCANAIGKIHTYMENGIFPGDRLLITAESSEKPFSTKDLDMLIEHFLK